MHAIRFMLAGAVCASLAAVAMAQSKAERLAKAERRDFGKREFEAKCASCHGLGGKGDGPVAPFLAKRLPDLTLLASKNGGVLPMARLYEVIEGSGVASHGTREMPVWGLEYRTQAREHYGEVPFDAEAYTRARILTVLEYPNRLQVK